MTERAIRSFEAQTYPNKCLLVLDSGHEKLNLHSSVRLIYATTDPGPTVGELRNLAIGMTTGADIIAHFDSDDWSHPERLTEQVSSHGVRPFECVGYNYMLFWDSTRQQAWFYRHGGARYALGASFCYWRSAWERVKFGHTSKGEDRAWLYKVRAAGVSVMQELGPWIDEMVRQGKTHDLAPRMICEIHGGNTSSAITEGHEQWTRVPEFDEYCKTRMEAQHANVTL
jgi:glycosyltransferase involved in cell wall biosynthesis